ncbi:tRNA (adenosine(37)-N6)-dimethylallyltransferase MiaA [Alicyclobacillus sp. ALC3]|uniref:tRNA (adenosine(37)-N6)-dimethylallyltransferase MiaA n=1 Tax=Alicyclobacillus sp. ALC3 TaxID=2796143 RepID=UPI002379F817|nr:tRNA (adenosine(37)-N6)-dimethylallyltransferase MiaA [Alicyclobacillus sp. ALC3]WDL97302.1 tRNA (adenosine(37)-N6)-dimethylallyltransferase MiaA [Alicyclobacillus sp. ALC3]
MKTASRAPVLCIVGPTGVGKSHVGIEVARAVGGEVVSADSMQVYRGMDIGTAKVTQSETQGVPHHGLDLVEPNESFTVANWVTHADVAIAGIIRRGRLPIVVGGTGLYIRAIVEDLDFARQAGSASVRAKWEAYLLEHGSAQLHRRLCEVDLTSANRLHPNDTRRVIRALEVAELRGQELSQTYEWRAKGGRYNAVQVGLVMDRAALYRRVDARLDAMVAAGLDAEVRQLLDTGCTRNTTAMQAIGYKEWAAYVTGETREEEAVAAIKQATRRLAKRQLSWFLRDERVHWFTVDQTGALSANDFQTICDLALQITEGIELARRE